jgi:transposase
MARALGQDLRERVLAAAADGASARGAAERFGVGIATAIVWVRRWREDGETAARRQGQPKGSKLDAHEGFLLDLVATEVDITLEEIRKRLMAERGIGAGVATLWRFFDARAITFKKNRARGRAGAPGRGRRARGVARSPP